MSHGPSGRTAYVALLHLLPRDFRERHGEEMVRVFEEMRCQERGAAGRVRCWTVAAWDVIRVAWKERMGQRRARRHPTSGDEDGRGSVIMDDVMQDLRYSVRQLARKPGFSLVLFLTIALGVGANTAVFSVVDGVVLRPLPYPHPDHLVDVWTQFPSMDLMAFPASWPEFQDYRAASRSFASLGGWISQRRTLTGGEAPERLDVTYFTWEMWRVLGVDAELGRTFGKAEDAPGHDGVVVLSHGLWERRFGSDPGVVGRTIQLDGDPVTVLGVMPASFRFPDPTIQAWLPMGIDPANPPGRTSHFLRLTGRLAPGVTLAQASTELHGLEKRWQDDASIGHSWNLKGHPAFIRSMHDDEVGNVRSSLLVLLGAVGVVLLIACANVANLLLVRGEGRVREVSIRAAMGAGRGRIVRQLITESLLLALLGGLAGLVLARGGLAALLAVAPASLPRQEGIGLNGVVLAFSAGVTLLAGLIFGLAPALQTLRLDPQGALREEGRSGTAGRGRHRYRQLLVVSQTGLAVMLLIAAGLLVRSFWRLSHVDPGFRDDHVLALSVSLPRKDYPENADVVGFYRDIIPRLSSLPGVRSAALVWTAPLTGSLPPNDIEIENYAPPESDPPPLNADVQVVSAGYFKTMGIPLLQGRAFGKLDDDRSEPVVVVDDVLARRFFNDPSRALGARIRQPGRAWARIVGIVGAVHQESLSTQPRAQLYLLHAQGAKTWSSRGTISGMTVLLRTDHDPLGVVAGARQQVHDLDANLPVYQVRTMAKTVAASTAGQRFSMILQLVFAGIALLLAVIGIYGVLSYSVAQRTREIGIRMALGAGRRSILRLVVGEGMALVVVAVVLGVGGALVAAGVLRSLLFTVSVRDPLTYGVVVASLTLVALVACWIPARRACVVDPQSALRQE